MKFIEASEEGRCPYCGSDDIEYGAGEVDTSGYYYPCTCNACKGHFFECYDLDFAGYNIEE